MGIVDRRIIGPEMSLSINATQSLIDSHIEYIDNGILQIGELDIYDEQDEEFDGFDELALSALARMTGQSRRYDGE